MLSITKINESFLQLYGDPDDLMNISEYFSFYTPNYKWSPKYRAGIWSGKIYLFNAKVGRLPIGLFLRLKYFCRIANIETEVKYSKKTLKLTESNITDYGKKLKIPHKLRDYQLAGIQQSFAQQQLIIKSPTASGKSLILYLISKLFLDLYKQHRFRKVLVIVPTIALVDQMKGDYIEYAEEYEPDIGSKITAIFSGQEKDWSKPIIVSTWQSLQNITDTRIFQQFGCVLVDEVFSAETGVQLQSIIQKCSNAQMKVGVAGTLNDDKINRIQLEGLFGEVNQETTTKKLMDAGILSKLKISIITLNYSKDVRRMMYKNSYHDEMEFLQNIKVRSQFIVNTAVAINKNVLILFKNLKYGELLYKALIDKKLDRKVFYVAGNTKREIRQQVRELTIQDSNAIIVASLGVFAIGINIPNLDYIIYGQNFKSKIKVLQSIGRILRKAKGKHKATLIDIVDNLKFRRRQNYALKHAIQRIEIYKNEQFEYNIKELEL